MVSRKRLEDSKRLRETICGLNRVGTVFLAVDPEGQNGIAKELVDERGPCVVKVTPEVMGKNWLHLRDGSGSREKKDDDITVTTTAMAAVGDVVVVRGVVHLDRDFGAGYTYPVIIEDAKVTK